MIEFTVERRMDSMERDRQQSEVYFDNDDVVLKSAYQWVVLLSVQMLRRCHSQVKISTNNPKTFSEKIPEFSSVCMFLQQYQYPTHVSMNNR